MPLYEFTCRKCGHTFEELMSMAEAGAGKVACPACASRTVEKGFSSFATGGSAGAQAQAPAAGCGRGGFT